MYKHLLKNIQNNNTLYKNMYKKSNSVANKQRHFIFSAENPRFEKKFNINHGQALEMLQNKGYHAESIKGKYGDDEQSIIIHNPPKHSIKYFQEFAKNLGQESSIVSNGQKHEMHFHHGDNANMHVKGEGTQFHKEQPEDNFSTLADGTHFSHHFDFDNFHKANKSKYFTPLANKINKSEGFDKYPTIIKNESKHPLDNAHPHMNLIHYSPEKQDEIHPDYHGVRKIGAEAKQGKPAHPMSFYYLEGVEPESIVTSGSKYKHVVPLGSKKIYDIGKDPDKLGEKAYASAKTAADKKQINRGLVNNDDFKQHYHQAIKDSGYHGVYNSSLATDTMSHVVGLFQSQKPESVHPLHPNDFKETSAYDHHAHNKKVEEASSTHGGHDPEFLVNLSNSLKE